VNEEVRIGPAGPDDLDALLELMAVLAEGHATLDLYFDPAPRWRDMIETMLIERLGSREQYVAVARCGDRLVGMVTAMLRYSPAFRESPRGVIENLVVEPAWRRGGLGTALVEAALQWSAAQGALGVELSVAVGNTGALSFYEGMGFRPVLVRLYRCAEDGDV
jgi:ribosomal protein S18 acetylase RimI-like enzyme